MYIAFDLLGADLGVNDKPVVVTGIAAHERDRRAPSNAIAYRLPHSYPVVHIEILWSALWKYDKRTLRCVARHEALHAYLGQEMWFSHEQKDRQHEQVDELLKSKWNEPPQCGLVKTERKRS
jgi:hypothetical protein